MKKYIKVHSTDIDYLMNYNESVTLEDFTENINNYVSDRTRIEAEHNLDFFIEESWSGDFCTIQIRCKRLETDFEYEDRIKRHEINDKIIQKTKLIEELAELNNEDLNDILEHFKLS